MVFKNESRIMKMFQALRERRSQAAEQKRFGQALGFNTVKDTSNKRQVNIIARLNSLNIKRGRK